MLRWARVIAPASLGRANNERVVVLARRPRGRVTAWAGAAPDGTVVEAAIHHPSDAACWPMAQTRLDDFCAGQNGRYGLLWFTNADGKMRGVPRDAFFQWGAHDVHAGGQPDAASRQDRARTAATRFLKSC